MRLNETSSIVHTGKNLSDAFHSHHNGLKQREALTPSLFNFALQYAVRKGQENRKDWNFQWNTPTSTPFW
jgi:hypothetical protein